MQRAASAWQVLPEPESETAAAAAGGMGVVSGEEQPAVAAAAGYEIRLHVRAAMAPRLVVVVVVGGGMSAKGLTAAGVSNNKNINNNKVYRCRTQELSRWSPPTWATSKTR